MLGSFKFLLVDLKQTQEHDVNVVDILRFEMHSIKCKVIGCWLWVDVTFRVLYLKGFTL